MGGATFPTFTVTGTLEGSGAANPHVPRGDDAGGQVKFTGQARKAFYDTQLEEFAEEVRSAPKAKKRAAKVKRLEAKLEVLEEAFEDTPLKPALEAIESLLTDLQASQIDYYAFQEAVLGLIARVQAEQRKRRNRNIAIAMLMAA
jgi:hypothetical protein